MQISTVVLFIVINLFIIIASVIGVIIYLKRRIKKNSNSTISLQADNGEINIEILASFRSFKFLPAIFSISHNNANPKLLLTDSGIKFRVFFMQSKPYSSIEKVDILSGLGSELIIISFSDSIFIFSGNLYTKERVYNVLKLLANKQLPLSEKSKAFLKSYETTAA